MSAQEIERNPLFELAEKWVNETSRNIFLTGKAGTGKTTFLRHIKASTQKNTVVIAPTGIAAINAGGSTIHSFFRLPFGTFIPSYSAIDNDKIITQQTLPSLIRYTRQHIQLIRAIELIIIDEVSMVRADVLDMIDTVLRRFRFTPHLPFGGVQILFIGDMYQLPPIVKDHETKILSEYYQSPYFFDSKVLKDEPPVIIQLEKTYRQHEANFLSLLNELRHNQLSEDSYNMLLSKVVSNAHEDDRYITLTSHVAQADRMNELAMQKLNTPLRIFKARIEGDFPEYSYPASTELALKKGARVMFIKNDPEKRYFNGKTGKVISIEENAVQVLCDDNITITVSQLAWNNVKYGTNTDTGNVEENTLGKFWQIPLRLAWAVTIHKSQGLTFDKVIIDAEKSFAAGQVYVALSRCRTWDGIILLSRINAQSLFTDVNIVDFGNKTWKHEHLENTLPDQQHHFQAKIIIEVFDLSSWKRHRDQLERVIAEFESSFSSHTITYLRQLTANLIKLSGVSEKFITQIHSLLSLRTLPEENESVLKRASEAATYFSNTNQELILKPVQSLPEGPDNAQGSSKTLQILDTLHESALLHQQLWLDILEGFSVKKILKAKSKAIQEVSKKRPLKWSKSVKNTERSAGTGENALLEQDLRVWRSRLADTRNVEVYRIISNKAIDGIVQKPPLNRKSLLEIKGIGKVKVSEFGDEILEIISKYFELNIDGDILQEPVKKEKVTTSTYKDTLLLYKAGMKIKEIAISRNLAESTIGSHLARLIEEKEISVSELLDKQQQDAIRGAILSSKDANYSLKSIKDKLDDSHSWASIKWMVEAMKADGQIERDLK